MLMKIVAKSTRNSSILNCPDISKPAQNLPKYQIMFHETSSSRDLYTITLLLAAKPVVFTLSAFCCKQSQKVLYISGSFWGRIFGEFEHNRGTSIYCFN